MLHEALERLRRTQTSYGELLEQLKAIANSVEGAIAQTDLGIEQHRDATELAGIAFNVRGGSSNGGTVGQGDQIVTKGLRDLRTTLTSARATAKRLIPIAQGQVDTVGRFIAQIQDM
jgi:hypothetical protein